VKYQKDKFSKELISRFKEKKIPQYIPIYSLISRSLISLCWVLVPYTIILNRSNFDIVSVVLSIGIGFGLAFISFQFHIVNHFDKKGLRYKIFGKMYDIFIFSSWAWKRNHNKNHHLYTNIIDDKKILDTDLQSSVIGKKLVLHWPGYLIKPFLLVAWSSFMVRFSWYKHGPFVELRKRLNIKNWASLSATFLLRIVYIILWFIIPYIYLGSDFLYLYIIAYGISGLIIGPVIQITHETAKSQIVETINGVCQFSWRKSQILSTCNFAMHNKLITWFTAGTNYHVEHHLFPLIDYKYYPVIAPVVQDLCLKHHIKYNSVGSFWDGVNEIFVAFIRDKKLEHKSRTLV
jgi:linoleoyl-CoA desaturase